MYIFDSVHDGKSVRLIMGKDKHENDLMIKYFYKEMNAVWFHVDSHSSSHVYVKLDVPIKSDCKIRDHISQKHLNDAMQLCKANSTAGNKLQKVDIAVTPFINLKKSGDMSPGQVSFKSTRFLELHTCFARDTAVLNRLEKTKLILDNEPIITEEFDIDALNDSEKENFEKLVLEASESQTVSPNLEEFLRKCKKSKDEDCLVNFVNRNKERLIFLESLRKKIKKISKTSKNTKASKKSKIIDGVDYSEFDYE